MNKKSQANSLLNFPGHRPRRMRRDDWSRRLMQENTVSTSDLIYPVFLLEGQGKSESVASMPGVNLDQANLVQMGKLMHGHGFPLVHLLGRKEYQMFLVDKAAVKAEEMENTMDKHEYQLMLP